MKSYSDLCKYCKKVVWFWQKKDWDYIDGNNHPKGLCHLKCKEEYKGGIKKMKKKNNFLKEHWKKKIFLGAIIFAIFIIFLASTIPSEPHFKITKDGVEVDLDWKRDCLEMGRGNCFSPHYDGVEWLNENCEILEQECWFVFEGKETGYWNASGTTEIIYHCPKGENCLVQVCEKPTKYSCGDYIVEVWKQIK